MTVDLVLSKCRSEMSFRDVVQTVDVVQKTPASATMLVRLKVILRHTLYSCTCFIIRILYTSIIMATTSDFHSGRPGSSAWVRVGAIILSGSIVALGLSKPSLTLFLDNLA